ncbi:hypothetical protein F5Y12DRAFT_793649 [Xylaria sp. FL1777]|nr:hypothetical protein F5Y12DRAFT_793649 [Xylaria sp. FL1777]
MATQILDTAQQESPEALPPELMLLLIQMVPSYLWPEVWYLGLTCHKWKFEIEKYFRTRQLPNMTIRVSTPQNRELLYEFKLTEGISGERAIFELVGDCPMEIWTELVANLRLGSSQLGNYYVHMITLRDLHVINNTELVGLQGDYKARSISIEWYPTLSVLFREERKLREVARADAEEKLRGLPPIPEKYMTQNFAIRKRMMHYMMHKSIEYQHRLLTKVRELYRRPHQGSQYCHDLRNLKRIPLQMPMERAMMRPL